MLLIDLRNRF